MPLIEELPITQSHRVSHGWAYVPDTGGPTIAAVQPGNRKRGRDGITAAATASATAKQQKAAQARLDSLDKENYKDGVSVPIPARASGDKKRDKKMTANVRRILTYQRGFAHYLADEEALASSGSNTAITQQSHTTGRADARRKSSSTAVTNEAPPPTPTPTGARRGRPPSASKNKMAPPAKPAVKKESSDKDVEMTDAPAPPPAQAPSEPPTTTGTDSSITTPTPNSTPSLSKPLYDAKLDSNPLLRTIGLPKMPSDRVMALLIAEPPLSYTAAQARIPEDAVSKPTRKFCAICGYWGKVKCRKCGEWTCGIMECWKGHESVCIAAAY